MLLYIHIPFCDSKCYYCAFNSYVNMFHLKKNYMKAICKQLESELNKNNKKIKTVFIGGGTPSSVGQEEYKEIFEIFSPYLEQNAEITIEANPNSASLDWLRTMYNYGVNRISFGVQSFDDSKLKKLGRSHTSKRAIKAIEDANCIGFKDINCDIIYGVKDDSFESLKKDFDIAAKLPINHISAYSLTIEEGTKFYNNCNIKIDDELLSKDIFKYLENIGFNQYEISNFALTNNARSKHNIGYWNHEQYLGIGAGAVGYKNSYRYYPNTDIEQYILNPLDYTEEKLSKEDIKVEKILLGLRSIVGFDIKLLTHKEKQKVEELMTDKKLKIEDNKIYSCDYLLADEIALYLLE